jgi:hypothetical protein
MSIVIQLVNGSPKKRKGEKIAGVILTRDPKLGFRMKVQAMPTGRELHRLVSDCPLAITEQTLLWLQRHKWQWKLHPNSLDVKELLQQVKTYTDLLPAEHIGDACDLLLQNFKSKNAGGQNRAQENTRSTPSQPAVAAPQDQTAMPTQQQMMQQMAMMQAQMMAMQQQMTGAAPAAPLDPLQEKMMRTRQRHASTMAQVNQTLAMNAQKEAMQKEVLENLDQIVDEVDSIIQDEPLDDNEEVSSYEEVEIEVPEKFNTPQEAWAWAVELGVYDDEAEAKSEYEGLKKSEKPKNAVEMASIWTSTCLEIYDMLNDSEEDSGE